MPRLNISGDWCAGIGGGVVSVNGQIVATEAGGACWMDSRRVVYQNCSGGVCRVESYNYLNAEVVTVLAHGANHIEGGGGLAAAWFGTPDPSQAGITLSDGRRFPSSGLGPVGSDGAVAMKIEYQSAGPWDVVETNGTRWRLTDGDAGNINLMGQQRAVWTDWRGVVSVNMPAPKVITSLFWWLRVLEMDGVWWALYQAEDGRLVLHPFDSTKGYVVAQGNTFRPDVCYLHGIGFRVVWAVSEGEPPADVRVRDIDPLTEALVELMPPQKPPVPPTEPPKPPEKPPVPPIVIPPLPALKTSERYWLHPNIDSDVVAACHGDLATVDVFGLYVQWLLEDARYGQLDTLSGVRAQGVNLNIEMGAIKPEDWHAEGAIAALPTVSQRVLAKGHRVCYLTMDEPLTSAKLRPEQPFEESVFAVVKFVEAARAAMPGVKVVWAEACPEIDLETQRKFLMGLDSWGCHLDGWHLDMDWHRAGKDAYDIIRTAKQYADDYKVPLGVYLVGYSHATDDAYFSEVMDLADRLHAEASWCIDHVLVQAWAARTGTNKQDLPANFGEFGLFPLFGHVQEDIFQ